MRKISNNKIVIDVKNLSYRYPDKTLALQNISFQIKTGECVGLIGPNGAGKSTLLLTLMGFLKPFKGSITLFKQELNNKTKKNLRMQIGMVFQDPNDQLFSPTLWEDLAFGPYNLGYDQDEINRRIDKTLQIIGLEKYKDKPPHHMSFGEKKRAALGTILTMDPKILLLDEPFSNLDPESYAEILQLIQSFKEQNLTIIIATHDVDVLPNLVDRCILLDDGHIIIDSSVHEVLSDFELLMTHKLRMPLIGQLFYKLQNHHLLKDGRLPLTLNEAELLLEDLLKNGIKVHVIEREKYESY
ncbi:MAG: energy-coupling factor ABC transporter ATP-binding protein [Candidatus Helarchaeota archaeon]